MRVPKQERENRIQEIVKMVGLDEYLHRKPQHLSGGQRQRVALARAIVKKPAVFLMDEPLSNLDAKLRAQIRTDLIQLYRQLNTTFVYVTHDQVEAMSMGTNIVLLDQGKIQQCGKPEEIYTSPRNMFSAQFIGSPPMNLLEAGFFEAAGTPLPANTQYVGFRPEKAAVVSHSAEARGDSFHINGELLTREMLGDQILYKLLTPQGIVQVKSFDVNAQPGIVGDTTKIAIKRGDLFCFDGQRQVIPNMDWPLDNGIELYNSRVSHKTEFPPMGESLMPLDAALLLNPKPLPGAQPVA
jgi:sn-glycerol 3-phosphate transport system ATP-binding protein